IINVLYFASVCGFPFWLTSCTRVQRLFSTATSPNLIAHIRLRIGTFDSSILIDRGRACFHWKEDDLRGCLSRPQ
ncbi:MAG TPA: hypothetical protein VIH54_11035, partial [Chthoniobacterales bacterium]